MATLEVLAQILREANPKNEPMSLQWIAEQWWPDAPWLKSKACNHNGGPRTGARVDGGMAARMEKKGLLRRCYHEIATQRCYVLDKKNGGV